MAANTHELDSRSPSYLTAPKSSFLSNKLTSILASSFVDSDIRDALRLLDARYGSNAQDANFDLKYEVQKEVIEANGRIIDDFAKVAQQLERVGNLIATLNQTCDELRIHIRAAKQETAPMLEDATTLIAQKEEVESKQELLQAFNNHFLLSEEDLAALTSSAEPVDEHFFVVLARVKQVYKDCEVLLGYENQRLGLELLEQTTQNLDAAYRKLHNWTRHEFQGLDLEDPQISGAIRRSLRALSERPALFQSCLDFFAQARQTTLSEAFQKALTDSTLGASKAIEFSTHDPLRYVGDMLAWVHSATVSEMEALEGLFISDAVEIGRGLKEGRNADPFSQIAMADQNDTETTFDGRAALNELTSRNMAQVARILAQRILLTIRNISDPLDVYKIYNLLLFYHDMLSKLVHHTAWGKPNIEEDSHVLLRTLTDLSSQTLQLFKNSIHESHETAFRHESSPSANLAPPQILQTMLSLKADILKLRSPTLRPDEYNALDQTLIEPCIEHCEALNPSENIVADEDAKIDDMIWKLNYSSLLSSSLASLVIPQNADVDSVHRQIAQYTRIISDIQDQLSNALQDMFVHKSGIDSLSHLLSSHSGQASSATKRKRELLTSGHLETLAGQLDTFLSNALLDAEDFTARIQDKALSKKIVEEAVDSFIDEFEQTVQVLEQIDAAVEAEKLRNGMTNGASGSGSGGEEEEDREETDSGAKAGIEETSLREVYPRSIDEVEALLQ